MLSPIIDQTLGQRCRSIIGYQYSEIIRSLMSVYFCGGSCVDDYLTIDGKPFVGDERIEAKKVFGNELQPTLRDPRVLFG